MRAIRLRVPRPSTSDSVLPSLLVEAGLVAPVVQGVGVGVSVPQSLDAFMPTPQPGKSANSSGSASNRRVAQNRKRVQKGRAGAAGASPLVLTGQQQQQQQEGAPMPPVMSMEDVLAVLPPQAAQSVWLAAFLSELKSQWGYPRAL
jgi:hypothetical protein